jgi:hypothetical protein
MPGSTAPLPESLFLFTQEEYDQDPNLMEKKLIPNWKSPAELSHIERG